jgi:hypothetical protein
MDEDKHSKEFYWTNVFFQVGGLLWAPIHLRHTLCLSNYRPGQVEDILFSVPRCEFEQSSEVFADMFLLPSGPSASIEGQDKEHPIVLEGYKKDDFACLLKVMYPTYVLSVLISFPCCDPMFITSGRL